MMILREGKRARKKRLWTLILPAAVLGAALGVLFACAAAPARIAMPEPGSAAPAQWSYGGDTGPAYWHALDPAYAIARDGKAQSPINIVTADLTVNDALTRPLVSYRETPFEIENNGHTIELTPLAAGNALTLDGETYELRQFHFHTPSEHRFDNAAFAMELHLVHENSRGDPAVIGVMIAEGAYNETLGDVFEDLPRETAGAGSPKREAAVNLAELFAAGGEMYRYDGSLTTPPCTEGVKWSIAVEPIAMSRPQIEAFRSLYRGNNRPVQNRYGRPVYVTKD
jgi:carbonic anhydrase